MAERRRSQARRLGRNAGGYEGETIDIYAVLESMSETAARLGWRVDWIPVRPDSELLTLHRIPKVPGRRFYFSTGIHGDEPAGPLAFQALLREDAFPEDAECWLLPCLNPTGFEANRRESRDGIDLNRDYRHPRSPEIRAHVAWLKDQGCFDCAVCVHEDWEATGFYLYALNPQGIPDVTEAVMNAVRPVFPIEQAEQIEGFPAVDGVIEPPLDPTARSEWPESIYLAAHHSRLGYTVETSSDFDLEDRVTALVAAMKAVLSFTPSVPAPN